MTVSILRALPSFKFLLDPAVLEGELELHLGASPEDAAPEDPRCALGDAAGEHGGDLVRSADADVVGHQRLEEAAGPAGIVEDQRAGRLDLAHRQLPPVAGLPVSGGERDGDGGDPAVEEAVHHPGPEAVADGLEPLRLVAGSKAVGECPKADPGLGGPAFGPLVAVDPDLGRIGEVRADLDEARPEIGIEHVEVVDAHAALLLVEAELHVAVIRRPAPAEDPLELLAGDDRHHPEAPIVLRRLQQRAHMVELAVTPAGAVRLLQPQHGDVVLVGEATDVSMEPVADLLEHRGRRERVPQVISQEPRYLTGDLQVRDIRVQVEPSPSP